MQVQSVRTTITLQPGLFRRLKLFAREQGKPISEIVETGVRQVIAADDTTRLKDMYRGLFALAGTGQPGITDASRTIDETLYGAGGAWKGGHE